MGSPGLGYLHCLHNEVTAMTESHEHGQMPGGRSSQGPVTEVASDEPQVEVPPYDGRTTGFDEVRASRSQKAFDASNAPEPGPEPALGVGKSTGRRAEDIAPDRPDTEAAEAGRSRGKAADDDAF